jgi:transcriptional regulator with XRE-family HTH domain
MKKDLPLICRNIKARRMKAGYSQDKLSKLAGTALHTISKIENGETYDPRISTVKLIADALRVSIDALLK